MRRPRIQNSQRETDDPGALRSPGRVLFERELPLIERVLAATCRRRGLFDHEADEFSSWARVKLLEDDCAILSKFGGRSTFKTYLVTVVQNLFRDYRISRWGRWRPSAQARRLGVTAVRLERLVHRDGFGFDEAARLLENNYGERRSAVELARLAGELPARTSRRVESVPGEEELATLGEAGQVSGEAAEERLHTSERRERAARLETALAHAMEGLDAEDRVILRMHFEDGCTVARVARTLQLDQKPLYRRIDRCLKNLRARLEEAGVTAATVADLLGWDALALEVDYEEPER